MRTQNDPSEAEQGHSVDGGLKHGFTTSQNKRRPAATDAPTVIRNFNMTLRCTAKLLRLIGVNPRDLENLSSGERRFEWYANLIWLDRRKCLLFTNSLTLFSFLVPDVLKYHLNPIGRLFIDHLKMELESEHLPISTFGPLELSKVVLAKTSDRSVLGSMNDLAKQCDFAVRSAGSLWELDVSDLNRQLRRTPLGSLSYSFPIDRAQGLVRDSSL